MQCQECPNQATIHLSRFRDRSLRAEKHLCDDCVHRERIWEPLPPPRRTSDPDVEIEIEIETIIISETHEQQLMVFREVGGGRRFSFVLGIFEATAIDRTLRGLTAPRPLTFEAWLATVEALRGSVRAAVLRDMADGIYFADLILDGPDGEITVDMRPSDAIHLALTSAAPIRIVENLLAEVAE